MADLLRGQGQNREGLLTIFYIPRKITQKSSV